MRIELTRVGLLVYLANHYTTRGALPRVLVLCEMKSVSSSIWTRMAVSISYDDNHCITGTSISLSIKEDTLVYLFTGISTPYGLFTVDLFDP